MSDGRLFARKGPVYVNGEHFLTFTRDIFHGEVPMPDMVQWPDGTSPQAGDAITGQMEQFVRGELEFTQ